VDLFYQHEGSLKWVLLLLAFVIFALWETYHPRRTLVASTTRRWGSHAILSFIYNSSAAWIYRASGVAIAAGVSTSRYGVLNHAIIPYGVRFVIAILLLDLLRYAQHYSYHSISLLWRIHRVHHADPDYDWSTSLRFHPAEILLSHGIYLVAVAVLAPPAFAVLCLELADVVQNIFVHANVALSTWIDAALRRFLITPDMHRIHHSDEMSDQNTNFGTVFPWWDKLFGTYREEPAAGYENMAMGLHEMSIREGASLIGMLVQPFYGNAEMQPAVCEPSASLPPQQ
jgi:sterol desaturase/sphingolipid hydroxylase (fatty acid hydroxylase superfamily)